MTQIQSDIYTPNVFSPNGDNINDFFLPVINCDRLDFYTMQIFDRWGNLLFESKQKDTGWNGKINNEYLNSGVYSFLIQYQLPGSAKKMKSGDITLVR